MKLNLAAAILIVGILGCGSGEPIVQVANLKYVQLLRTAISSRDRVKVDKVLEAVRLQQTRGDMDEGEITVLTDIGLMASDGDWSEAERAYLNLEQAQQSRRR